MGYDILGHRLVGPNSSGTKFARTSSPRCRILLKLPGQALGHYLRFFVLRPFDIKGLVGGRPTQGADDMRLGVNVTLYSVKSRRSKTMWRSGLRSARGAAMSNRSRRVSGFAHPDITCTLSTTNRSNTIISWLRLRGVSLSLDGVCVIGKRSDM